MEKNCKNCNEQKRMDTGKCGCDSNIESLSTICIVYDKFDTIEIVEE